MIYFIKNVYFNIFFITKKHIVLLFLNTNAYKNKII